MQTVFSETLWAGLRDLATPPKKPAAGAPTLTDLLDPVVLRTMPPRVAAFMLYEPPEPPPWRYRPDGVSKTDTLEAQFEKWLNS
jgi:hypothetical protein